MIGQQSSILRLTLLALLLKIRWNGTTSTVQMLPASAVVVNSLIAIVSESEFLDMFTDNHKGHPCVVQE